MKKTFLLAIMALVGLVSSTDASAQWSTDHESEYYKVTDFPNNAVAPNDRTFDVSISTTKRVAEFMDVENLARQLEVVGWRRVRDNAFLHVDIVFDELMIEGYDVVDKTTVVNGRRTPGFAAIINYTCPVNVSIKSPVARESTTLFSEGFVNPKPVIIHYETDRLFDSPRKATDFARDNREVFMERLLAHVSDEVMRHTNRRCKYGYGFGQTTARMEYYHLDSKKCPYLASQNQSVKMVKDVVRTSSAEGIDEETVLKVIDDYQTVINGLDEGVKKQRKAKIKLIYSIAELYLMIDHLEDSERVARMLIDKYKEKDGNDVLKKIEKVRKIFDKFDVDSRHPEI